MSMPRRIRLDLATPPEAAIRAAMAAVEIMGCDILLTEAGILLSRALNIVGAVVDKRIAECAPAVVHGKCAIVGCDAPAAELHHYCDEHRVTHGATYDYLSNEAATYEAT